MKLLLSISERLYALLLLNQFKGNLEVLVDVLEDTKKFRITDEEWKKANKQIVTNTGEDGKPVTSWNWDDEKGGEKEIEITKKGAEYLIENIKESDKNKQFTIQDKAALTLLEKLEKRS